MAADPVVTVAAAAAWRLRHRPRGIVAAVIAAVAGAVRHEPNRLRDRAVAEGAAAVLAEGAVAATPVLGAADTVDATTNRD